MDNTAPILIIEDSMEDFEATVRTFRKCAVSNPILCCKDGDDALDFIYRRGAYEKTPLHPSPSLVLLDLNLPGTDGREVLERIKTNPDTKVVPVVVLTTSDDERDVRGCYKAGANSYIQKPVDMGAFVETIRRLKEYWLEIVVLPEEVVQHG